MNMYLTIHPSDRDIPSENTLNYAHMAYTIKNFHLLRGRISSNTKGGMMVIYNIDTSPYEASFKSLSAEIYNECLRRNFSGVILDLDAKPTADTGPFSSHLYEELCKTKLNVFVPYLYSPFCPHANYIASSSISGGSLREHLSELIQIHGQSRMAVEIERLAMDFTMPSASDSGKLITPEETESLIKKLGGQSFYSSELYTNYFTYSDNTGQAHFVLYDDARSIADKISLAQSLGFDSSFIVHHQIRDISKELIQLLKS